MLSDQIQLRFSPTTLKIMTYAMAIVIMVASMTLGVTVGTQAIKHTYPRPAPDCTIAA